MPPSHPPPLIPSLSPNSNPLASASSVRTAGGGLPAACSASTAAVFAANEEGLTAVRFAFAAATGADDAEATPKYCVGCVSGGRAEVMSALRSNVAVVALRTP
eukprot:366574-Chlamydomonas_euryale.AAC.12